MSQTVIVTNVNNVFYREIQYGFMDKDEAIEIVKDMLEDGTLNESSIYDVMSYHFEISEAPRGIKKESESGTEEFFSEEQLLEWCKHGSRSECNVGILEKELEKRGYCIEPIQEDAIYLDEDDLEDDE